MVDCGGGGAGVLRPGCVCVVGGGAGNVETGSQAAANSKTNGIIQRITALRLCRATICALGSRGQTCAITWQCVAQAYLWGMKENLTVIYNDTCPICAREVGAYRTATDRRGLNVAYAGLSQCDLAQFGLTPDAAARRFHVMQDGVLQSGIPAFALLWETMPRLRWLARLVRLPGLRTLAAWVYDWVLAPPLYALHKRRLARGKAKHIA